MSTLTAPALPQIYSFGHPLDMAEDKIGLLRDSADAADDVEELRRQRIVVRRGRPGHLSDRSRMVVHSPNARSVSTAASCAIPPTPRTTSRSSAAASPPTATST